MHVLSTLAVLSAATSVIAAPANDWREKRGASFSIDQVSNPNYKKSGAAALRKAYNKFGVKPSNFPTKVGTHSFVTNGTVTATPLDYDSEYLCPVDIDGQTLMLDFDSGSSDL
jgi:aspergillopepsin I